MMRNWLKFLGQFLQPAFGGGGDTNTNTIQKSDPWGPQQDYLKQIFAEAMKQYQGPGPTFFGSTPMGPAPSAPTRDAFMTQTPGARQIAPGSYYGDRAGPRYVTGPAQSAFDQAGFDAATTKYNTDLAAYQTQMAQRAQEPAKTLAPVAADTTQAQAMARGLVPGQTDLAQNAASAAKYGLTQAVDVNNNPFFQSAVAASLKPMQDAFMGPGGVLAGIRSDYGDAGQYGGSRMALAQGTAAGRLADAMGNVTATMGNSAYNAGLDAQGRTLALLPNVNASMMAPVTTMDQVGAQVRQQQQDFINENIKKWNFEQNQPAQKLATFQNLVQGNFGGEATSSVNAPGTNPLMAGMGGAALGYSFASAYPTLGLTGPMGAGLGALAMLLLSQS